jgi:hypothetical protein
MPKSSGCRRRGVEEGKCGSNLVDSKAVAQVGARTRVPGSTGVVVEEGKCRKNLVDFKPVAGVGARTNESSRRRGRCRAARSRVVGVWVSGWRGRCHAARSRVVGVWVSGCVFEL